MCGTSPGAIETFNEQVCMPINGRVRCIDKCIHHIVAALNAGNVRTIESCCGHNLYPGSIFLEDGRCLGIYKNQQEMELKMPDSCALCSINCGMKYKSETCFSNLWLYYQNNGSLRQTYTKKI